MNHCAFSKILIVVIFPLLFAGGILAQETELPTPGFTPDSPFYLLEKISEGIGTFFTFGDLKKAERYTKLAAERVAEAQAVVEKGKPEAAQVALKRYEDQLGKALAKTETAKAKGQNIEKVTETVARATSKHLIVLEGLLEKVPDAAKEGITRALEKLKNGHITALKALARENPGKAVEINIDSAKGRLEKAKQKAAQKNKEKVEKALEDYEDFRVTLEEISEKDKILIALVSKESTKDIEDLDEIEILFLTTKDKVKEIKDHLIDWQISSIRDVAREDPSQGIELLGDAGQSRVNKVKARVDKGEITETIEALKEYEQYTTLAKEIAQFTQDVAVESRPTERLVRQALRDHLIVLDEVARRIPEQEKELKELILKIIRDAEGVISEFKVVEIEGEVKELEQQEEKIEKPEEPEGPKVSEVEERLKIVTEGGFDVSKYPQNTPERLTGLKKERPIVNIMVHFELATENIDLSNLQADIDLDLKKSFFYALSWPEVIENGKIFYIPSSGVGTVYLCPNAKSLTDVTPNCPNRIVINLGETVGGITMTLIPYNGETYYMVYPVTGLGCGGGEATWIKRPDLMVSSSDVSFSNNNPILGDKVTINAVIHNIGEADVDYAYVAFYDGDPKEQKIIGWDDVNVAANKTARASVVWTATTGSHEIYVWVEVSGFPSDSNPTNNMAYKRINVWEGVITGTVVDYNGLPVVRAFIQTTGPDYISSTYTDKDGSYTLSGLKREGKYVVGVNTPSNPNLTPASCSVNLVIGKKAICNFTLEQTGSIAGMVTDATGKLVKEDTWVYLSGFEPPRYKVHEHEELPWHYVIHSLKAGTHTINIENLYGPVSYHIYVNGVYKKYGNWISVEVKLGQTTLVDFTLQPPQ